MEDVKMKIDEFIEKNDIAIFVKVDLRNKRFEIIKKDVDLESYDLFEQLIILGSTEKLKASLEGQLLPRIWTQGNTKCVLCQPNNELMVAIFYDKDFEEDDGQKEIFFEKREQADN